MRESKFVDQNKDKWAQFEKDLDKKKKDPHVLRAHLVQITDDLSYSRTFYRNRSVRIYLNGLAQKVYNNIYKNKKNFWGSLKTFYLEDIPKIVYFCRKELLVSFIILLVSVTIGMFSSAQDDGFARSILGDEYVEMTLENIKQGNPMGVYKGENQFRMFFGIGVNNLRVSLIVFIAGILASYGALVILAQNGIMLGVFIYFFYSRNLASEFNLTVWMHGSIEILTLVVEAVAGMLLGRGLVYPGTLSRAKAFSIWGKRGAMLFLALVPFIIFAAFIESFLTRYTEMPNLLRLVLILMSVALMLIYFVWYPLQKFYKQKDVHFGIPDIKPETQLDFNPSTIYSNGQIFLKTIQLIGLKFSGILRFILLVSLLYLVALEFIPDVSVISQFKLLQINLTDVVLPVFTSSISKYIDLYGNLGLLFNSADSLTLYLLSSTWLGLLAFYALYTIQKAHPMLRFNRRKSIGFALLFSFLLNLLLLTDNGLYTLAYFLLSPLFMLALAHLAFDEKGKNALQIMVAAIGSGYTKMLGLLLIFVLIGFIGMVFIVSPLAYLSVDFMEMNVNMSEEVYTFSLKAIMLFAFIFLCSFNCVFYMLQCTYLSFALKEITEAEGLQLEIENLGKSKKAYGIETE